MGYNANPAVAHVMTAVPNHLTTELQAFDFADGVLVDHEFADGGIVLGDEPGSGITIDEVAIEGARRGDGWRALRSDDRCARARASCSTASSAETKDGTIRMEINGRTGCRHPLGERFVALYLLVGEEGALLVDTGIRESITETLLPPRCG